MNIVFRAGHDVEYKELVITENDVIQVLPNNDGDMNLRLFIFSNDDYNKLLSEDDYEWKYDVVIPVEDLPQLFLAADVRARLN